MCERLREGEKEGIDCIRAREREGEREGGKASTRDKVEAGKMKLMIQRLGRMLVTGSGRLGALRKAGNALWGALRMMRCGQTP